MNKIIVFSSSSGASNIIIHMISKYCFVEDCCEVIGFTNITSELKKIVKDNSEKKIFVIYTDPKNYQQSILFGKFIRKHDIDSELLYVCKNILIKNSPYFFVKKITDVIVYSDNLEHDLISDIKSIIKKVTIDKRFIYITRKYNYHIYYKDITYITRDTSERKAIIYTTNNIFPVTITLSKLHKLLGDERFIVCHKACIVNVERVQQFCWCKKSFILDTGEEIELLSKKYRRNIETYFDKKNT